MKTMIKSTATLGLALLVHFAASANIVTYPAPAEVTLQNPYLMPSTQYSAELTQGSKTVKPFVYMMNAMWHTNNSITTSWTQFDMDEPVVVRITKTDGNIKMCNILPRNRNITPKIEGNTVEFTITEPGQYSVEFEKGIKIAHPMLIFADAPEVNIPDKNDPNVHYFGPGSHNIGNHFEVKSGQTVYIAGGAYVKGQILTGNSNAVTIRGRGILSGEAYAQRTANHMINIENSTNTTIEGITIIHAPRFNIHASGQNLVVNNVKMMGWWFSTDGVNMGENGIVENCFFKVNDDAVKLYSSNTLARNCVIWQMENGAPFQIGWSVSENSTNFTAEDCDVIRVEHEWDNENEAVFCAIHGGMGEMSHFVFRNITVDNSAWRTFSIQTKPNRWGTWHPHRGSITDIIFENITVYNADKKRSIIKGWDAEHPVSDIRFSHVTIGGEPLRKEQLISNGSIKIEN